LTTSLDPAALPLPQVGQSLIKTVPATPQPPTLVVVSSSLMVAQTGTSGPPGLCVVEEGFVAEGLLVDVGWVL
jgi:hypothetical protein